MTENYIPGITSVREAARKAGVCNHTMTRWLKKAGIPIVKHKTVFSEEHKKAIGRACKGRSCWSKGLKMTETTRRKNMLAHLRFKVDFSWSCKFDIDVLMAINSALTPRSGRFSIDTDQYKRIVEKWGNHSRVLRIVQNWKENGKNKYLALSFDHIKPRSKGGTDEIDNLSPMTWFENRSKNDMSEAEWSFVKTNLEMFFL